MPDREAIDSTLERIGVAAMAYYPEVQIDEPAYQLSNDVEWCLEPLHGLEAATVANLRDVIARVIVNPTEHRQAAFNALLGLIPE